MKNDANSSVGAFLKDKRVKANLTQKEISDIFKFKSAQFVSNWERGISVPPTIYLPKLCQLLKIDHKQIVKLILLQTELELQSVFKDSKALKAFNSKRVAK